MTDFISKMDDIPKTHGGSSDPLARKPSPIPIVDPDGIHFSGGFPPREQNGNTSTDSRSGVGGQGTACVRSEDEVLVEIFILPLCPGKSFQSIRMSDVVLNEMTNGILLALFVLCKRENHFSGIDQAKEERKPEPLPY